MIRKKEQKERTDIMHIHNSQKERTENNNEQT